MTERVKSTMRQLSRPRGDSGRMTGKGSTRKQAPPPKTYYLFRRGGHNYSFEKGPRCPTSEAAKRMIDLATDGHDHRCARCEGGHKMWRIVLKDDELEILCEDCAVDRTHIALADYGIDYTKSS